jgi:DoxX-like family/AMP-binding enzyme C-terminal domain/AMP-binding enzyme
VKVIHVTPDGGLVDCQPGQVGVLAIGGPTVFPGYVVDRGPDGPVLDGLVKLHHGWLDTGDLARIDEDGFVHLAGRAKDLIIRGGHNLDPAVIEGALLAHPEVTAAEAVGRPDVHAGEVPVAFVTLAPGARATAEDLTAWAAQQVPEQAAAPKSVTVLDALPVTHVGKPFKPALRAAAAGEAVAHALRGLPPGQRRSRGRPGRRRRCRRGPRPQLGPDLRHGGARPLRPYLEIGTVMTLTPILAGLLVVAFTAVGSAKLAAVPAMREKARHVGYNLAAYRRIGLLEILGVVGLLVGGLVPAIGALAAVGLLLLLGGAFVVHLRKGDGLRELAPSLVLGLVSARYLAPVVGNLR